MQENCTCGSVRGALGNRRPYRDSKFDRRDVWVGLTLVQISFSPANLDSILQVQSGSHQSPELLEGP
jgi:hypothetical protein